MTITSQSREIQALIEDIRDGRLLLPELQRRFVWKATQVRDLFDSLYHQYPSGQLLLWETDDLPFARAASLDNVDTNQRRPQLLLDGQQRLTSLAAVMLGRPLIVRNSKRPIDVVFNVYTEKFEVAGIRQRGEVGWISLAKLFTEGAISIWMELKLDPTAPDTKEIFERLKRLENIKTYKYQINVLEKLNYDEVTHIFVRINSGGTTLGSADLALAQISSRWRGVTQELDDYRKSVWNRGQGLWLDTSILVRLLSVMLTGQNRLSQLFRGDRQQTTLSELESAWRRARNSLDQAVAFLVHNCKIDRLELLPTQYVLIPLAAFFDVLGTNVSPTQARDLQRWVYMALIWARYSASAETAVDQDVAVLLKDNPIQIMTQYIEDKVGRRPVTERELQDQRKNSPYMLVAYVLARLAEAPDWFNGVVIGSNQTLEFHHIFPKDVLREQYDLKTESRTIDQVANLAFLSQKTNSRIRNRPPVEYLPEIDAQRLKAQSVPLDSSLWAVGHFEDFLRERRILLADAINHLLLSLTGEHKLWPASDAQLIETRIDALERQLRDLITDRLVESRGEHAWDLLPSQMRGNILNHVEQYKLANPFDSAKYDPLASKLELCQFSDYPKIIRVNWALFQDIFGDEARLTQHHKAVTDARNALKHNRSEQEKGNPLNRAELASAEAGLVWMEDCLRAWSQAQADEESEDDAENGN